MSGSWARCSRCGGGLRPASPVERRGGEGGRQGARRRPRRPRATNHGGGDHGEETTRGNNFRGDDARLRSGVVRSSLRRPRVTRSTSSSRSLCWRSGRRFHGRGDLGRRGGGEAALRADAGAVGEDRAHSGRARGLRPEHRRQRGRRAGRRVARVPQDREGPVGREHDGGPGGVRAAAHGGRHEPE